VGRGTSPTVSLTLSCCLHCPDGGIRFFPPHMIEAEGPQPTAAVPICHSPFRRRPWWPFLSRRQHSLYFPSSGVSSLPMDSAAVPSLPRQWWWWQQAASPLPLMVAMTGTLSSCRSRSSSHGASRACGGAQSTAVMCSTTSRPPWLAAPCHRRALRR
jgi:hypothetical protein